MESFRIPPIKDGEEPPMGSFIPLFRRAVNPLRERSPGQEGEGYETVFMRKYGT
jgi:hypothetical protein